MDPSRYAYNSADDTDGPSPNATAAAKKAMAAARRDRNENIRYEYTIPPYCLSGKSQHDLQTRSNNNNNTTNNNNSTPSLPLPSHLFSIASLQPASQQVQQHHPHSHHQQAWHISQSLESPMGCNLTMNSQHVSTPLSRCYDNGMYHQSGYQEIWHHQQFQQQHQHIQIQQQQQQQQHILYRDSHQEQKYQDQWKRFEHDKSKESHNKYHDRVSSCTSRTNTTSSPARKSHHDKHKLQGSRHNYLTQFSKTSTTSKGSNTVTATKSLLLQPPVYSLYFSSRESPYGQNHSLKASQTQFNHWF